MEVTINSKILLKSIQSVGSIIKTPSLIPICETILFDFSEDKILMTSDNLEIRATEVINAQFEGVFSACVGYSLLNTILKGLPDVPLKLFFEKDKNKLSITCEIGKWELPIHDAMEFTSSKEFSPENSLTVNALEFSRLIRTAVQFTDDKQVGLGGVLIRANKRQLTVAGVSSASFFTENISIPEDCNFSAVISKTVVSFLSSVLDLDQDVTFNFSTENLFIGFGSFSASARLLDYKFPDYEKIFNQVRKNKKSAMLNKDNVFPALKRMASLSSADKSNIIFSFSKNELTLTYQNLDLSYSAEEKVIIDSEIEDF